LTRFALTLEFDGGPFMGLQRQDHGPSVQEAIERAVHAVTGETVTLHSAGRTDSGVHALAMVSHVDIAKKLTPFRLMEALNAKLRPDPIAVIGCEVKPDDWHARFSCIGRKYEYRIANRRPPLTLERGHAWQVTRPLDAEAMHRAAQALVGLGKWREAEIAEALAARDRSALGLNAPPEGLFFVRAVYPV
jgi:tRNA pseudouridine38-40 synthase